MLWPFSICECMNLRVAPSARTAHSLLFFPLPPDAARYALTCAGSSACPPIARTAPTPGKGFPEPATRPAHEAVVDRRRRDTRAANRTSGKALENTHDTADDATIINPLDAANIGRQVRLDPRPPLLAQPKQVPAHGPDPLPKTNQDPNVRPRQLLCSDPSQFPRWFGRLPRCRVSSGRTDQWGMESTKVGLSRRSTDAAGCRSGTAVLASKRAR